jgi:hypothetical protein
MKETFIPTKSKEAEIKGIKYKTKYYQEKGYRQASSRHLSYEFSDFRETKDSICFYDLNHVTSMVKLRHRDSLKVKKGYVIIRQDINEQIIAIEIKELIFSELINDSLISKARYDLTPKHKVKSNEFSNFGIFKEKITLPNTVYN